MTDEEYLDLVNRSMELLNEEYTKFCDAVVLLRDGYPQEAEIQSICREFINPNWVSVWDLREKIYAYLFSPSDARFVLESLDRTIEQLFFVASPIMDEMIEKIVAEIDRRAGEQSEIVSGGRDGNVVRKSAVVASATSKQYSSAAFKVVDDYDKCMDKYQGERMAFHCRIAYLLEMLKLITAALGQVTKLVNVNFDKPDNQ